MMSVADAWKSYADEVIAKNAPRAQKAEVEIAFYAGVHALLCMLRAMPPDIDANDGVAIVNGWQKECETKKDEYLSTVERSRR